MSENEKDPREFHEVIEGLKACGELLPDRQPVSAAIDLLHRLYRLAHASPGFTKLAHGSRDRLVALDTQGRVYEYAGASGWVRLPGDSKRDSKARD